MSSSLAVVARNDASRSYRIRIALAGVLLFAVARNGFARLEFGWRANVVPDTEGGVPCDRLGKWSAQSRAENADAPACFQARTL
jgi:hypothetical protein